MSFSDCSMPVTQKIAAPSSAPERVREGLSVRRNAATPGQEKSLVKTLNRLEPAANAALSGASGATNSNAVTAPSFSSVLVQLSHA